jgi:hypothetical protein
VCGQFIWAIKIRGGRFWFDPRNSSDLSGFEPELDLTWPDLRLNDLQSNWNYRRYEKTYVNSLDPTRPWPNPARSDFFQKVKLTRPVWLPPLIKSDSYNNRCVQNITHLDHIQLTVKMIVAAIKKKELKET